METLEYFEENVKEELQDEIKMEIKAADENTKLSQKRKYSEYFEEDVKEEVVDEKEPQSNLVRHLCDICSKSYKSKGALAKHIQSLHEKVKYPCDQCQHSAATKTSLKSLKKLIRYSCNQFKYKATQLRNENEKVKYPSN